MPIYFRGRVLNIGEEPEREEMPIEPVKPQIRPPFEGKVLRIEEPPMPIKPEIPPPEVKIEEPKEVGWKETLKYLPEEMFTIKGLSRNVPKGIAGFFKGVAKGAAQTITNIGYHLANFLTPSFLFPKEYKKKQKEVYSEIQKRLEVKDIAKIPGKVFADIAEIAVGTGLLRQAITKAPTVSEFIANYPKITKYVLDPATLGVVGTTLEQIKRPATDVSFKERLKEAAIDFPLWTAWGVVGGLPRKAFYAYLPGYFSIGYLGAKLEGQRPSEAVVSGLASAAIGGVLKLKDVPKPTQDVLRVNAQKVLDKYKIRTHADYLKAMRIYHPDRPTGNLKIATQINAAWDIANKSPKELERSLMREFRDLWRVVTNPRVPADRAITIPSRFEAAIPKPEIPPTAPPKAEVPKPPPEIAPKPPERPPEAVLPEKRVEIPPELKPLAEEARKYKSAEEFVDDQILFAWIKSFSPYRDIKSLKDVPENELAIFKKDLEKEIKKSGVDDVGRQIRNVADYYKIEIPDILTRKSQLIDFYNQAVKGIKPEPSFAKRLGIKATPSGEALLRKEIPQVIDFINWFKETRPEYVDRAKFSTYTDGTPYFFLPGVEKASVSFKDWQKISEIKPAIPKVKAKVKPEVKPEIVFGWNRGEVIKKAENKFIIQHEDTKEIIKTVSSKDAARSFFDGYEKGWGEKGRRTLSINKKAKYLLVQDEAGRILLRTDKGRSEIAQSFIDGYKIGGKKEIDFWHRVGPEVKPKAPPKPELEEATPEKTPIKGFFTSEEQRRALWVNSPHIAKMHSYGIHWGDLTPEQQKAVIDWTRAKKKGLPPEVPEPTKINKLYAEGVERARKRPVPPKIGLSIEAIASQSKQIQSPEMKAGLRQQLIDKLKNLKEVIKPFQFYPDLPMPLRNAIRTELISGLTKISDKVYNETYTALWGGLKEKEIAQSVELIFARDQLSRAKLGKGDPRITVEEAQKLVDKLEKEIFPESLNAANRYRIIQEEYRQKLVDRKLLDPDQKIDDYVRHYVEDYTPAWVFRTGIPTRLRRPFRGYIKPAVGTTKAYRKDADVILGQFSQMEKDNLFEDFIKKQAFLYDKKADLTKEEKMKLFGVDKAGRIRLPKPGRIYYIEGKRYRAYTPDIPFSRQVFPVSDGLMALGRYKKTYLLPENVYNAFREFSERGNYPIYVANRFTGWWKTWAITSRFVPFNINNMIGDSWMIALQAPEPHRIIPELNTMLNYVRNPQKYPDFDKFLKDNGVLDSYFIKELPRIGKLKNPIAYVLEKAREISGFRENILRIAYASYLHKGYLKGEGEKLVKYHNWIDTEGLITEKALGKIARDILIDYGWVSKTFHRIIRGVVMPFATWYLKGSHLAWRYTRRHLAKALLFFLIAPVLSTFYNNRDKKIRELEQKLPDGIRDRIHFVIGENPDGTIRAWYAQFPQDMWIGTKIFSIAVNQANMVINKEKTIKEAAVDTLKRWGIKEGKGIIYLQMPMVRFLIGLINQRDPYDGLSVYSTDPRRLTPEKRTWEQFLYFQKVSVPFLGEFIYSVTRGVEPIDIKKKEAIETFVGLRALGVLDVNKKAQVRYFDEETGEEKFLEWEDYEKIQRLGNQEAVILAKIENDWVNSGLMPEEFVKTKEFQDSIFKIKKLWIKHNPKAEELTTFEVATALDERLANSLGEDITSAQRWLRVQLERAKTDKEKKEIGEKYQKIREIKLIDSLKKLPKTAREIYLEAK